MTKELPHPKSVKRVKKKIVARRTPELPRGIDRHGRPKRKVKLSPAEREAAWAKQQEALKLRMAGATYGEIASTLGYANPSSAKYAVDACIGRAETDAAKDVVALDLARLDEYQMRCTHALRANGDLHQIDRLMRIMEMRYRLLGVSDETIRAMQENHGVRVTNQKLVMNIHAAPETEQEFIAKMMKAVGVDPTSEVAQNMLREHEIPKALPMLTGSANDDSELVRANSTEIDDEDIVEGEIVDEL